MYLIGLDVGTTGCKSCVFDEAGDIKGYGFREYDIICTEPAMAEQDAMLVWRKTVEVLKESIAQSGAREIKALSLSVQGDAVMPVDKNYDAIYNCILGMDYRSAPQARRSEKLFGARRLFNLTGMRPHPINSLIKIMWLKQNRPAAYAKAWKIVTYADFILGRLGSDRPVIDYTMASRTMAFDLKKKCWSAEILKRTGIDRDLLSEPVVSGEIVGTIKPALAQELGIAPGMLLVAGGHDQPCAALGAGVVKEGRAVASTGTAEVCSTAFFKPALNAAMFNGYYPCYIHAKPDMYFTFSLNHIGGLLYKWFRDTLGQEEIAEAKRAGTDPYALIDSRMPKAPGTVMVLPHFNGSGTPWCDMSSKGAIVGITMATNKYDIARAILESLTYELRINLETMREAGIAVKELVAVGGGAKSPPWLQMKADILGRTIITHQVREAACLGAALTAGTAAGVYASLADAAAKAIKPGKQYTPDPKAAAVYRRKYAVYRELYPSLKKLSPKL
jgi:xylulokinase